MSAPIWRPSREVAQQLCCCSTVVGGQQKIQQRCSFTSCCVLTKILIHIQFLGSLLGFQYGAYYVHIFLKTLPPVKLERSFQHMYEETLLKNPKKPFPCEIEMHLIPAIDTGW